MERAALVDDLRILFATGGYAAIMPTIDAILAAQSPLHGAEWWRCFDCGWRFDSEHFGAGPAPTICPPCAFARESRRPTRRCRVTLR